MVHRSLVSAFLACLLLLGAPWAAAQVPMRMEASVRLPDGKILVAGEDPTPELPKKFRIGRINADGSLDATFIGSGWVTYVAEPWVQELRVTALAVAPDGKIVTALVRDGSVALVRFDASGSLDTTFGTDAPGLATDSYSAGLSIKALTVTPFGHIVGFGSYLGSAALVRYGDIGYRDLYFGSGPNGVKLPFNVDSELRAAASWINGGFVAAGYKVDGGFRQMLVAMFTPGGELDYSFGYGGYVTPSEGEAFGLTVEPGSSIMASGRDNHFAFGQPAANIVVAKLDRWGYPDYSFGNYSGVLRQFISPDYSWDNSATAMSAYVVPGGSDIVIGGTVVKPSTGRAYFFVTRYERDWMPPMWWYQSVVGPQTEADDVMTAAYPNAGGQIVAVGTRDSLAGESALRVRYFADTGEFDTDFPTEGEDTTPNPFAFDSYYLSVDAGYQAESPSARITGINVPTAISVTGGEYWIGCTTYSGTWTSDPGFVLNGQSVCLRATAANTPNTTTTATLSVGGVQASFTVTTGFVSDTTIDSHPPATGNATAQFTYSWDRVSGNPSYYECRLDAAPFAQCPPNGITYTGLELGSHTFEVRTVNSWGTDPTPAAYTWNVAGVPDTTITSSPAYYFNQTSASVSFTSPDTAATFECRLNGAAFAACTSPKTYTGLGAGGYTFEVRARNVSGADPTPAQAQWIVDTTAPDTSIPSVAPASGGTYGVNSFVIELASNDPTAHFEYSLDGSPFAPTQSPIYLNGLANGNHTFAARAVDPAGNADPTPVPRSFTVDTTPPATVITGGPGATSTSPQASFFLSPFSNQVAMECTLDGAPRQCWVGTNDLYGLRDGTHVFVATARRMTLDGSGNLMWLVDPTPESRTWVVDLPPPETSLYAPSGVVNYNSAQITFSSDNYPVTFECSLNGAAWSACSGEVLLSNLADGTYTFAVRASTATKTDPTPAMNTWTVDRTPPQTILSDGPQGTVSSTSATFVFSSNEGGASFYCGLDAAPLTLCSSPKTYTGLTEGSHTFNVLARDAAGTYGLQGAARTWTVQIDVTPPETTITAHPYAMTQSSDARFSFAASESGVTFQCRRDGGPWYGCWSDEVFHDLTDGTHNFEVRAIDTLGNIDATPAAFSWTVDSAYGPDTAITSAPIGTVGTNSATITFNSPSGTPAVGFNCAFAGSQFACTSPWTVTGLADGEHFFIVSAIDAEGNIDRYPASVSWIVDTSAPDTAIDSGPTGTVAQSSAAFTFSSPQPGATFQCSLDAAAFTPCGSGISYAGLAEGMHMFEVRARDAVGNADPTPASRTWSVDTTAPNTTITSGPSAVTSQTTASIAFSATEAGSFQCKLDGAAYSACTSPAAFAGLAAGSHSFSVYSVDALGNADASPATWSWAIDITAPDTSITSGPSGTVAVNTASIAFSSPDTGATFECRLDGGAYAPCTSPASLTGLADGLRVFEVRAKDAAGNADPTPASRSWTVDTAAPDTTISSGPAAATTATSATFQFTASGGATAYECKLDAGAFAACTSPKSYSGLANGSHTFQVRARDAVGNVDASPATWTWTVDTVAPDTTITGGPTGTVTATSATFTFTATEGGSTFECQLDSAAYAACVSPKTYTGIAKGNHTFRARARDPAGNLDASPATRTWKIN